MIDKPVAEIEMPALSAPADAEVRYRMDVSFRVAITPIVARQNANVYLLMNVGNMLSAGDPVLSVRDRPYWKVPIYCAFPEFKHREKIGELAVDMNNGAILLEHSFPSSPQEIERHAEIAYVALATSQQEHSASCLAACVVMALSYWQLEISETEVRRIIRTKPYSGTHPVNLLHLGNLDFNAWPYEGTEYELRQRIVSGEPVIVFLWTGVLRHWAEREGIDYQHTVIVAGWSDDAVFVHDPILPDGPIEILWAEFSDAWRYSRQMMAVVVPGKKAV